MATKKTAKKTFILRGDRIDSYESFMAEFAAALGLGGRFGRNLDALIDALRGGLGSHAFEEPIRVVWADFSKSARFDEKREVLEIMGSMTHVEFVRG